MKLLKRYGCEAGVALVKMRRRIIYSMGDIYQRKKSMGLCKKRS